jgi:hypothetical protein
LTYAQSLGKTTDELKGGTSACGQLSLRPAPHDRRAGELIGLTAGEIRLFAIATQHRRQDDYYLRWSHWRRRHQARARKHHYQRRQQRHLTLQG